MKKPRRKAFKGRVNARLAEKLYDADPKCRHKIVAQWSGVKCEKCGGWFCY